MRKITKITKIGLVAVCVCIAVIGIVLAGNSEVSDPTITVTAFTIPNDLRDKTHESLDSLDTAVEAVIDAADAVQYETGTATNSETITFTLTYASAPVVLIQTQNATTNSYASSITASNCVANMVAGSTNTYVVLPIQ